MHKRIRFRLIVVIVLSLLGGWLMHQYLTDVKNEVAIYVARQNITPRTIITEAMIEEKKITYRDKIRFFEDAFESKDQLVGKVSAVDILRGDVFINRGKMVMDMATHKALRSDGTLNDPEFIPLDHRLVAVNVKNKGAILSKTKKNDFVDVIYTSLEDRTGGLYSGYALQHIQIYDLESLSDGTTNVYLLVTAENALKLSLAKTHGEVDLALNPTEGANEAIAPHTVESMIGYRFKRVEQKEAETND